MLGAGGWPLILDMADAALRLDTSGPLDEGAPDPDERVVATHDDIVRAAAELAPRWEDLATADLPKAPLAALADLPIGNRATHTVEAGFFAGQFAEALAKPHRRAGLLFRNPQRYDDEDAGFFLRAVWEATRAGVPVAIEGPPRATPLSVHLPIWPQAGRHVPGIIDPQDDATRLLAVCPRGLPLNVLLHASDTKVAPAATRTEDGFDGRAWVWLTPGLRRRILAEMPAFDRRQAHLRLFDAWPVSGWDYLRRAPHAWESGATDLIAAQAVPVAAALRALGARFALRHMRSLALVAAELDLPVGLEGLIWAHVAKLLPPGRNGGPSAAALPCLGRAFALTVAPVDRIERLRELADHHAAGSKADGFAHAKRLYNAGFRLLQTIEDRDERLRQQVRLLQGLAQVIWQARKRTEALDIEARAHALVVGAPAAFPDIEAWAQPLRDATAALTQAMDQHRPDVTAPLEPVSLEPLPPAATSPDPMSPDRTPPDGTRPDGLRAGAPEPLMGNDDTLLLRAQAVYAVARRMLGRNPAAAEAMSGLDSLAAFPPHILAGR